MNLANKRKEKGMMQKDLAERVGKTAQAISNYEVGVREPNLETLKNLASVLECTVDELLEEEHDDETRAGSPA